MLGLSGIALTFWGFRWAFANAPVSHDLLFACRAISNVCRTSGLSASMLLDNPARAIFFLALTAFLASIVKGAVAIAYSRRIRAEFTEPAALPGKLERLAKRMFGDKRPPFRISSDEAPIAFTNGIIKPSICITTGLIARLDENELEAVIAHEYAHILRKDNFFGFFASILKDFLFPLPISHFLFGLFLREKELAADELAVRITDKPYDLVSAMLTISRMEMGRKPVPGAAFIVPLSASAETRAKRLLCGDVKERLLTRLIIASITSAMIVALGAGIAVANPKDANAKRNCHAEVDCTLAQNHGSSQVRNSCTAK